MTSSADASRPPTASGVRAALVVAVAASAMAALVHAAAAGAHEGDQILVWMFTLCAAAQLGWAATAVTRPGRAVLALGLLVNGGALLVWSLTRTVGISFVGSLAEAEEVGPQDLAAALLAAVSVAGVLCLLVRPTVRKVISPAWTGVLAAFALVATMPALAAGHTHEHADHTHLEAAGHDHAEGGSASAGTHSHEVALAVEPGHEHGADTAAQATDDGHDHGADSTTDLVSHDHTTTDGTTQHEHPPTTEDVPHDHPPTTVSVPHDDHHDPDPLPTGPIISLVDPRLTGEQRTIAEGLIAAAHSGMSGFVDEATVTAAGYLTIGDGGVDGYEHFVKWAYLVDAFELDPAHIESIVMKKNLDGTKTVVSAMYILSLGKTMADAPPLAGELTSWHYHDNLCFELPRLVALAVDGSCPRGVLIITPPMLHVWMVENPCGPFAGVDEHGVSCDTHVH